MHTSSPALPVLIQIFIGLQEHVTELSVIAVVSLLAYALTVYYIPKASPHLFNKHLFGIDINKTTLEERQQLRTERGVNTYEQLTDAERKVFIPESVGIVAGAVYLSAVLLLVLLLQADLEHLSGPLATITVMLLLGFVDDVLDIRWRYKILLSAVGCVPLVFSYQGGTSVVIPRPLLYLVPKTKDILLSSSPSSPHPYLSWFQQLWEWVVDTNTFFCRTYPDTASVRARHCLLTIGPLYLIYLTLLCIFCTNSINILAGVNGVEVGQSLVIAVASILYNLIQYRLDERVVDHQLRCASPSSTVLCSSSSIGGSGLISLEERQRMTTHRLYALLLLAPFVGVSAALWRFNRYPSRVFVGDAYTYFAGTVLAVAAIAGLYSKTLLLFFAPQFLNFFLSTPQLFGVVRCPPHRTPRWDPTTRTLHNSGNYTLLNAILYVCRTDMREPTLTYLTLWIQVLFCAVGFMARFGIASWLYDHVE